MLTSIISRNHKSVAKNSLNTKPIVLRDIKHQSYPVFDKNNFITCHNFFFSKPSLPTVTRQPCSSFSCTHTFHMKKYKLYNYLLQKKIYDNNVTHHQTYWFKNIFSYPLRRSMGRCNPCLVQILDIKGDSA